MSSIRSRLLIWQIGALLLASLLASALTYDLAWRGFNRLRDYGLEQIAYSVMRHDTQDWLDDTPEAPNSASKDEYNLDDKGQFVSQIWTSNGQLIYSSMEGTGPPLQAPGLRRLQWNGTHWRTFTLPDGDRMIQVATTTEHRWTAFAEYAPWLLAPMALLLALLTFLIRATVKGALSPLERLRHELGTRDAALLSPMDANNMPDEVRPLVDTLNQLLAKVDHLLTAQRQFLADVAHELNTPLAAIKLQAQLAQRAQQDHKPASLDELHAGIERAVHLVAQLLQMARLEPDAQHTQKTTVDLTHLARDRIMAFSAQADELDIDLGLDATDSPICVSGDPNALRVLLDNLIDNALRYTPRGARVDVLLQQTYEQTILAVVDNGPGIADADKPQVLERFVRLRPADTTGSGLGLAIVRQIAQQHQAELTLTDTPGGGLTVRITWPKASKL